MMRSMFSAVSGLSAHQAKMDVIGNNIANVNTVGFKAGRVTFAEAFSQTIRGASSGQNGRGGQNPMQIGLGINVGAIETIHTRGAVERTDIPTDLMINGEGFFIVSDDVNYANQYYTRAGNFQVDEKGNLLTTDGYSVLGYRVDANTIGQEKVTYENELKGLIIDKSKTYPAKSTGLSYDTATSSFPSLNFEGVKFEGNLNAKTEIINLADTNTAIAPGNLGTIFTGTGPYTPVAVSGGDVDVTKIKPSESIGKDTTFTVLDELGGEHQVRLMFVKAAPNLWAVYPVNNSGKILNGTTPHLIEFDPVTHTPKNGGSYDLIIAKDKTDYSKPFDNGASSFTFRVDFSKITQYENDSDISPIEIAGYKSGSFDRFEIGPDGVITVKFSNGMSSPVGRIALAKFRNPAGLIKLQSNLFDVSPNSGNPLIGKPTEAGFATLSPGSLEMSNVDLSKEFTTMITTQRGFQANSRIITVTDEMLQELANLKR